MASGDVAIVRRGFDAFESKDMDAFVADWHPEVEWDVSGYDGWPGERQVYRGAPEILAEFANFLTGVRSLDVDVHEVVEIGPGRVLALYTETRREVGVSEPVVLDIGIVYTLRDGRVRRMEVYTGHERARRAATSP